MAVADFVQLGVAGVSVGAVYALIAVGFVAIFTVSEVINLAQGEFAALAGLLAISATAAGMSLAVAGVLALAAVTLVALATQLAVLRPVKEMSTLRSIILTLGVATVIRALMLLLWGPEGRGLTGFPGSDFIAFGVLFRSQEVWIFGICLLVAGGLVYFYEHTLAGKALQACAQQPDAARLVGISAQGASLIAFAIAGATGALAGLVASPLYFSSYESGLTLGLKGFVGAAMAGLESMRGAVIGSVLLGLIESYVAGYIDSGLRDAVAFIVLIVILVVRPQGILRPAAEARV